MSNFSQHIAAGWIAHTLQFKPTKEMGCNSWRSLNLDNEFVRTMDELLATDRALALEVIDSILQQSSDAWILENLGAGPIEYLLVDAREPSLAGLANLCAKHATMRQVLDSVWIEDAKPQIREEFLKLKRRLDSGH